MALKATVFKAKLQVADLDRHYYAEHRLTLARASSETDERLMVRIIAFALNAGEDLLLTSEMAETEEPSLWRKDPGGRIRLWIEVGLPEPRRLKKASGRADEVLLYLYHGRQARLWWEANRAELEAIRGLAVVELAQDSVRELAALAERSMDLQVTIQDAQASFTHEGGILELGLTRLL
ncbi:MAG TPA: YaeQ family protein [Rectinemataceae bacterium]|nr:YaeQ family protein [Rectinemataceae bacterium]